MGATVLHTYYIFLILCSCSTLVCRSTFFDLLSDLPPHTLATVEVSPLPSVQPEGGEGSERCEGRELQDGAIKVMSAPGTAASSGSVVVSVPKQLEGCGIQPRDWYVHLK